MTDATAGSFGGGGALAGSPTAESLKPAANAPLTTADGTPLKTALGRAQSRARWRAFALVVPLLAFILVTFVVPIGQMLWRSAHNPAFSDNMPALSAWFKANPDAVGAPDDEAAWEALHADLVQARKDRNQGSIGMRINYDLSGSRSLFTKSARRAGRMKAPFKEAFLKVDKDWGDDNLWGVMRRASNAVTPSFYIAAVDMTQTPQGDIVRADEKRRVYIDLYARTLRLSAIIAGLTLLLGFPIAHLLATLPMRYSNLLMIMVLLPFWTSLLVRTTSWMVLLQSQGVVNDLLVSIGVVGEDGRIQMMYNELGTVIAMTHILLPFMVLPLYSVMKTIPPSYVRAARSLGATQWTAFWKVYFPQTVPGIGAGLLLVFILAVGYYITPALVGGAKGTLISNLIAFHMEKSFNWSLAAALGAILLFGVLILYWVYDRLVGVDNMKLG